MKKKDGFILREIGSEYVLTCEGLDNVDFSQIISFNDSAATLWTEIGDEEFDVQTLADILTKCYEVDEQTASDDAQTLVTEWQRIGIITE